MLLLSETSEQYPYHINVDVKYTLGSKFPENIEKAGLCVGNSMFPLGNKFSRKDQLTKMLVPLQSSIILRKNMVDS